MCLTVCASRQAAEPKILALFQLNTYWTQYFVVVSHLLE